MAPGPIATYRGRELRPTAGLADRLRIESAICSHERLLPPSAEPSIEGVSQVLRRIVTPEAFNHFERILRVANVELEKLLVFRTQSMIDPVGASALTLQEDDARRDIEEEDRRTEVLKEFGVATKQTRRPTANDWAIEESHALKHYLTGVLGRIILDFTKYAETVLRWRRDDADDTLGEGNGSVKMTETEHEDLMKKLEQHEFAYSTLESKCNALAVELRDNRRAFLREKLVWKEQLRKIMAHLPEQEQARVMRKGLHQSVEFYDESNNVADAEAVRDEYEMLILQIKEEQNARAEVLKSEIEHLHRKIEEQEEAKRALMMRRPVSAMSNGTSGTRETGPSDREETLARQNAMLQEELRKLHLKEKARDTREAGAKRRIQELEGQLTEAKTNLESLQSTIDAHEAAFGHMPHDITQVSQEEQQPEGALPDGVSGHGSLSASLISMGTVSAVTLPGCGSRPGSAKLATSRKGTDFMVPEATQTDDSLLQLHEGPGSGTIKGELEAENQELREELLKLRAQLQELSLRKIVPQIVATTPAPIQERSGLARGMRSDGWHRLRRGAQAVLAAVHWRRVQQMAALESKKEIGPPATMSIIEMQLPMQGKSTALQPSAGSAKKDNSVNSGANSSSAPRSAGAVSSTSRGLLPGLPKGLAARRRSLAAAATESATAKDAYASSTSQWQSQQRPRQPSPTKVDAERPSPPSSASVSPQPASSSRAIPANAEDRGSALASPPVTAPPPTAASPISSYRAAPTAASPISSPAAPILSTELPGPTPISSMERPIAPPASALEDVGGILAVPPKRSASKGHMRKGKLQEIELGQHVSSPVVDHLEHVVDATAYRSMDFGDVSAVTWATEPHEVVEPTFTGRMLLPPATQPKYSRAEGNAAAVWQSTEGHPLDFVCSSMSPAELKGATGGLFEQHGQVQSPRPAASRMPLLQRTVPRNDPVTDGQSDREAHIAVKFQVGGGFSVKGGSRSEGAPLEWRWPAQSNIVTVKTTVPVEPEAQAKRPNSSSAATRPNKMPQKGLPRPSTTPGGTERRLKKAASDTQVQGAAGYYDRRGAPEGSGPGGRHRPLIPAS